MSQHSYKPYKKGNKKEKKFFKKQEKAVKNLAKGVITDYHSIDEIEPTQLRTEFLKSGIPIRDITDAYKTASAKEYDRFVNFTGNKFLNTCLDEAKKGFPYAVWRIPQNDFYYAERFLARYGFKDWKWYNVGDVQHKGGALVRCDYIDVYVFWHNKDGE